MIEGVALYKSNKEFAMKVLSKYMKVQDREILEENFREYDFPLKPYPSERVFRPADPGSRQERSQDT